MVLVLVLVVVNGCSCGGDDDSDGGDGDNGWTAVSWRNSDGPKERGRWSGVCKFGKWCKEVSSAHVDTKFPRLRLTSITPHALVGSTFGHGLLTCRRSTRICRCSNGVGVAVVLAPAPAEARTETTIAFKNQWPWRWRAALRLARLRFITHERALAVILVSVKLKQTAAGVVNPRWVWVGPQCRSKEG